MQEQQDRHWTDNCAVTDGQLQPHYASAGKPLFKSTRSAFLIWKTWYVLYSNLDNLIRSVF